MKNEKFYKCRFSHCEHEGKKVSSEEAVKINNKYWHRDCYQISLIIQEIIEDYKNVVSNTVVYSVLKNIINNIIFGKKLLDKSVPKYVSDLNAALYLEFAFQYAINHNIPITHPQGLYYLIDNVKVKDAWKKKKDTEIQKAVKDIEIPDSNQTTFDVKEPEPDINIFGELFD